MSLALDVLDEKIAKTADVANKIMGAENVWRLLTEVPEVRSAFERGLGQRLGVLDEVRQDIMTAEMAVLEQKLCDEGDHEWVDARNDAVESGEYCRRCGALKAGNDDR